MVMTIHHVKLKIVREAKNVILKVIQAVIFSINTYEQYMIEFGNENNNK